MKLMYKSQSRFLFMTAMLMLVVVKVSGQSALPAELNKGSLKEQINYLEEKTRIYEFYRAIREDMFQKIKTNVLDTIILNENTISGLSNSISISKHTIDSLTSTLETTKSSLGEITQTKNSIRILGKEVNKVTYNSVMWTLVACLIAFLIIGFLAFKRTLLVTNAAKKDYKDLKDEFDAYRKTTREAREKMSMDHFKEMQKLKGG